MNVNTKSYWENRFSTGDWENKDGFSQTRQFAESQLPFFGIPSSFDGTFCDFGCGAGDAFPLYRAAWPRASLMGVDISEAAIDICRRRFGDIATFRSGDVSCVPRTDVIISSNTFEHLDNDKDIARQLLEKCNDLFIIVPFREQLAFTAETEHVNAYDLDSFDALGCVERNIFRSKGWGVHGLSAIYHVDIKNLIRPLVGKRLVSRQYQIMYRIKKAG